MITFSSVLAALRTRRALPARFIPRLEAMEPREVPAALLGLTTGNTLVTFNSSDPGTILSTRPVTGLAAGETLLNLDVRPATGGVYALGSTNQVYLLNLATGAATAVGGPFAPPGQALTGTANGFNFNPVPDAIRVTSNANQNFRLSPSTGQVLDGNPNVAGIQGDSDLNPAGRIVGSAYTNNVPGATTTTLYGIDSASDMLVRQGGLDFPTNPPSPNTGQLTNVGRLNFDTDDRVGFDIYANGTAFASLTPVGGVSSQLFTIDLMTGAATNRGTIGGGVALRGLTALGFVVTNTNDSGPGSLRQAILDANATAGRDTILFSIGTGGPQTISPTSALPEVTEAVLLSATSQPGFAGAPIVGLDGTSAGVGTSGLVLADHTGSQVRGFVVTGFDADGIVLTGGGGHIVQTNYIGTNAAGTADAGNREDGIFIDDSANNQIGGATAAVRNVISGNDLHGIEVAGPDSVNNRIQGNLIGTNAAGTAAVPNGDVGVLIQEGANNNLVGGPMAGARNIISGNAVTGVVLEDDGTTGNKVQGNYIGTDITGVMAVANGTNGVEIVLGASNNLLGGTEPGAGNVISGNGSPGDGVGVELDDAGTSGNLIQGNLIGVDATGTLPLGNGDDGILIEGGASNNTVGGTAPGAGNVIAANGDDGIDIEDSATTGNIVQGNFIGTDRTGTRDLGNAEQGVELDRSSGNRIGGTGAGAGNVIAFNRQNGVFVVPGNGSALGNTISGNSIFGNRMLGIDLAAGGVVASDLGDGVTVNDPGDADTGGNNLQNFPILTAVTSIGSTTTVSGTLSSTPNTMFRIELFANAAADASGFGEGQMFLGSVAVTTDGSGKASFTAGGLASLPVGTRVVTATATNVTTGDTSEFSAGRVVRGNGTPGGQVGGARLPAITVSLQRVGRRKRLVVVVRFADSGAVKSRFLSPFQRSRFRKVSVVAVDTNRDGVADSVLLLGRRNGKTRSLFLPG